MRVDLFFGYLAGILTLINPCVVPVLPIVLASALQASRAGPLALAAGMSIAFVFLGVTVSAFGYAIGVSAETIANAGAVIMIAFGLVLLVPRFSESFATVTGGFAGSADAQLDGVDRGSLKGQFLTGALLGAVWSPCVGPTLGGAIALASTGENLGWATAIMISFAAGVSTIILALSYGAQSALRSRAATMRKLAVYARPAMGAILVLVGTGILFKVHHMIEIWALDALPIWLQDLSVRF
ncbi:MAG: cytochrome c biogenesis CcdA family protein [Pseudomonadota bacterium]